MTKVADAKDIILLYEVEGVSERQIAKRLGISRGTVARVLGNRERYLRMKPKKIERSALKLVSEIMQFIDNILEADKQVPRKQRHTSRLIWQKVLGRFGTAAAPAESTVRHYVSKAKRRNPEPFIPLAFPPGESMQGDFGEVIVSIAGERCKVYFWAQRLCYCRAVLVRAFLRPNQEAFLDGQQRALQFFGGVPNTHIIDNMKAAIKDGVGKDAVEQDLYSAFAAHYGFRTAACNGASGNEKGQVENLVGFVQRNWFTGLPEFASMDELNEYLYRQSELYLNRHHPEQRNVTIGQLLEKERHMLRSLPQNEFACCKSKPVSADKYSLVTFECNRYSIPTYLRLETLILRNYADRIEIVCAGSVIASYLRSYGRGGVFFTLTHYLGALQRKPRALEYARPFQETDIHPELMKLHLKLQDADPDHANRRWIEIMIMGSTQPQEAFLDAIQESLRLNRLDLDTIKCLCNRHAQPAVENTNIEGRYTNDVVVNHQSAQRFDEMLIGRSCA